MTPKTTAVRHIASAPATTFACALSAPLSPPAPVLPSPFWFCVLPVCCVGFSVVGSAPLPLPLPFPLSLPLPFSLGSLDGVGEGLTGVEDEELDGEDEGEEGDDGEDSPPATR